MSAAPPAPDLNCAGGDRPKPRVLDVRCWDRSTEDSVQPDMSAHGPERT